MEKYLMDAKQFLRENGDSLDCLWKCGEYRLFKSFARHANVGIAHGATRIVLIGETFVIKMDLPVTSNWMKQFGTCFTEWKMYKLAQEEGYEYLLAECIKMKGGHHYYYVMPKIQMLDAYSGMGNMNELDDLSAEEINWLDGHIFDLHNENYGYDEDGNYVAFDYAANCCVRWQ